MSDTTITAEERARIVVYGCDDCNLVLNALESSEAEVARLTKERDWLAEKVADLEDHSWTGNNSQVGKFAEPEYWKEAASRAVADSEVKA